MKSLRQIFYESLLSTSRSPRWWILALAQVAALYLIGEVSHPHWLNPWFFFRLFLGVVILVPVTTRLWMEVDERKLKRLEAPQQNNFIGKCNTVSGVLFFALGLIIAGRLVEGAWAFFAVFSSLVAATATLGMLYAVLCDQPFHKALALALDTWGKKFSLAATVAFVLILGHGLSFALVHGAFKDFSGMRGFPVGSGSATIWILFSVLIVFVAVVAAFLNSFLVLLFIETIRLKKDPEAEQVILKSFVASQANS